MAENHEPRIDTITSLEKFTQWLELSEEAHKLQYYLSIKIDGPGEPDLEFDIDTYLARCPVLDELRLSGFNVCLSKFLANGEQKMSFKMTVFEIEHNKFTTEIRDFLSKKCPELLRLELTSDDEPKEEGDTEVLDEVRALLRLFPKLAHLTISGKKLEFSGTKSVCIKADEEDNTFFQSHSVVDFIIESRPENLGIVKVTLDFYADINLPHLLSGLPRLATLEIVNCGEIQYHGENTRLCSKLDIFIAADKKHTPELLDFLGRYCPDLRCLEWTTQTEADSLIEMSEDEIRDTVIALPNLQILKAHGEEVQIPTIAQKASATQERIDDLDDGDSIMDYLISLGPRYVGLKQLHISVKTNVDLDVILFNLPLLQVLVVNNGMVVNYKRRHKCSHEWLRSIELRNATCSLKVIENISQDCPNLQQLSLNRIKVGGTNKNTNVLNLVQSTFILKVGLLSTTEMNRRWYDVETELVPVDDSSKVSSRAESTDTLWRQYLYKAEDIEDIESTARQDNSNGRQINTICFMSSSSDISTSLVTESSEKKRKLEADTDDIPKPKKRRRGADAWPLIIVKTRSLDFVQPLQNKGDSLCNIM